VILCDWSVASVILVTAVTSQWPLSFWWHFVTGLCHFGHTVWLANGPCHFGDTVWLANGLCHFGDTVWLLWLAFVFFSDTVWPALVSASSLTQSDSCLLVCASPYPVDRTNWYCCCGNTQWSTDSWWVRFGVPGLAQNRWKMSFYGLMVYGLYKMWTYQHEINSITVLIFHEMALCLNEQDHAAPDGYGCFCVGWMPAGVLFLVWMSSMDSHMDAVQEHWYGRWAFWFVLMLSVNIIWMLQMNMI